MDINKCIQIVLTMTPDQRTFVYEKVSKKCNPIELMQLNAIFQNAQHIWEQHDANTKSNNPNADPKQAS